MWCIRIIHAKCLGWLYQDALCPLPSTGLLFGKYNFLSSNVRCATGPLAFDVFRTITRATVLTLTAPTSTGCLLFVWRGTALNPLNICRVGCSFEGRRLVKTWVLPLPLNRDCLFNLSYRQIQSANRNQKTGAFYIQAYSSHSFSIITNRIAGPCKWWADLRSDSYNCIHDNEAPRLL